ncbi:MAG TPA: polyprenol monophosphomannose synthase [Acidimicrobiales bacterium]|jgi:dolichol-phosphate mannosyltransferase|nr:polyprenol monophosphomannose synthase [Acidimicrobiales bacterium]
MRVLVVLPTYNESENIEQILRAVRSSLPSGDVLVVDDSSPDGTADIAKEVSSELGQIDVVVRPEKNGLGPAYRAGFAWGIERGYDAFVEMDSDFSHDPAALPSLVTPVEQGADLAIGSRYVPGGSIPEWSFPRRMLSRLGNLYADAMLHLGVRDSTAGFRVYSANILSKIDLSTVHADGYGFQIEMTYRTRRAGGDIIEVPIRFIDRVEGESKMSRSTVSEALAMVTRWGAVRAFEAVSRTVGRKIRGSSLR